jgi:hypothetical protein
VTARSIAHRVLASLLAAGLSACVSPIELNRAVIAYDTAADDTLSRELLLNIARARHNEPLHFTGLSNIAATFNFQMSAGATPPLGGTEGGFTLSPLFGTQFAENPTFSIVPIEGEEFTKRLLTPFPESILTLLLRQGADVDLVLRMMAAEYRTEEKGKKIVYANKPADKDGYVMFRRIVLHLSSIQDAGALFAEPLIFEEKWTVPGPLTGEALQTLQKDFSVTAGRGGVELTKRTIGRIIVTNYDPKLLSNDERSELNDEAERSLDDEVVLDIRPSGVGGNYPLHGKFRLRSFANVITFIGRSMGEEPEYDVARDPRTPQPTENPAATVGVVETDSAPAGADRYIKYAGHYYALRPESGYQWNRKAFVLLYELFEMTVVKPSQAALPTITIAK